MLSRLTVKERQRAICFASVSGSLGDAVAAGGAAGAGGRVIMKTSLLVRSLGWAGTDATVDSAPGGAVAATAGAGDAGSEGEAVGAAAGAVSAGGRVQRRPTPKAAARRTTSPAARRALFGFPLRGAPTNRRSAIGCRSQIDR
jgi:hypothetical protein